ncbi:MAG: glycoside hydrolase family 3 C-terminal domain-containing protein, partial [Muribaculaceae bacterium]|nr:glycoside hydrolase family 3 C-terminal domain-containing protein [Muribaculaceae bacterium]
MDAFINNLMGRMTLEQKLGQMNLVTGGDMVTGHVMTNELDELIRREEIGGVFNVKGADKILELQRIAVEETELGIPLLVGADIIHGYETVFPIPLALSCSWDTAAVETMARISAIEASADGINWTFSPMMDICRDPRWGRIAEGNGEDPYLGSVLGPAYVRGYQGKNLSGKDEIMSCVKHFALYGAVEGGRDYNTVDMSRQRMFNEYFPPYEAAIRSGAASVMNSFNLVDGIPAAANKWLMVDVLRERWGFNGLLVTDYASISEMSTHGYAPLPEASVKALEAGTDMDMVSTGYISTLSEALENKAVTMEMIDNGCRRVLEAKYRLGLFENPYKYGDTAAVNQKIFTPEHRRAARDIAAETFVLLKNEGQTLPLASKGRIALVGPLADAANNMCGMWSMTCTPSKHRSLLEVMTAELQGKAEIVYSKGCNVYADETVENNANGIRPIARGNDEALLQQAMA